MTRRGFLQRTGWAAACGPAALAGAARAGQRPAHTGPNVLLILTDDQGYGDLACHGNPHIRTPHLDRLHADSVRLTNFHVAPTCSPTRAGLMTGRSCNRTGVWHTIMGRSLLRADEVTLADRFAAAGYRTGVFGKWHLGDNYPFRPQDRGVQETLVHGGGGVGQTPDYWGNDYFDDTYRRNGRPTPCRGYCTDVFFRAAGEFIAGDRGRPFFCYLATNAPHSPFRVGPKYERLYDGKPVPNAAFYGMITNIDENVGWLLERLRALGLEEETLVIFMTDNGTSAGLRGGRGFNASMRGTKGSEYDGGHRVPCFLRWPGGGLVGGRDIGRLTANIDLVPTLADLCRLPRLDGPPIEGRSLRPLLAGTGRWPDRTVVVDSQRVEHPRKWRKSAVMDERWRLVNGRELYDMQTDPGQRTDVAARHPDEVARLRKAYGAWWAASSRRFDEPCRIVLGSDRENPSRLTCHDWHGRRVPWSQETVRRAMEANGDWAVEFARDGRYEFALRRWPEETGRAITEAAAGEVAVRATRARLRVAGVDLTGPVEAGAAAVTFQADLPAGPARLRTWLLEEGGGSRGAYYVSVRRLGG